MRSILSKAVLGTMIAAGALAVSACTKTETTNVTDMNVTDESTVGGDNMTAPDAGAMNDTGTVSNDAAPATTNTAM